MTPSGSTLFFKPLPFLATVGRSCQFMNNKTRQIDAFIGNVSIENHNLEIAHLISGSWLAFYPFVVLQYTFSPRFPSTVLLTMKFTCSPPMSLLLLLPSLPLTPLPKPHSITFLNKIAFYYHITLFIYTMYGMYVYNEVFEELCSCEPSG